MDDGRAVKVATVGNEGMVGMPVFLQAAFTSAHMARRALVARDPALRSKGFGAGGAAAPGA